MKNILFVFFCLFAIGTTVWSGVSAPSNVASSTTAATPDRIAPSVPYDGVVTAVSTNKLTLKWTASTDGGGSKLGGYKVFREGILVGITSSASFSDNRLSSGTRYCYTISAYDNAANESALSTTMCGTTLASAVNPGSPTPPITPHSTPTTPTLPAAPTSVTAIATSHKEITLQWVDNANNEAGYIVERSSSSTGPWTQLADLQANASEYRDTGLSPRTTYYYRISVYN